ncbi:MAG: prepilin-type N-terminal cleavage/methylation domain-containing protein, partial [Gallionellaceae bacterium]
MSINRHPQAGFSLLEMSIVLAIVGLLLAGLLPTLSGQIEQQHVNETRKQMNDIKDALIGYAIVNGRLPYPASASAVTGTTSAGVSDSTLATGVIPWVTLG